MDSYIILAVILLLGVLSKNTAIWIAAGFLILIRLLPASLIPSNTVLHWTDEYAIKIGVAILTIGVLVPIALGKISGTQILNSIKTGPGILAVIVGIAVAYLGGRGTDLLVSQPIVIIGLLVGTIVGVVFFGGIPVGPLIAAGVVALFSNIFK
ncbi:DUF441 domain-containing protein [Effusibacillus dendaii]|uniref:UPF0756 membrane protein skT53_18050 n=1 Tax=Effusibacillus dendaii TaxID=2743772 RepID=A0A7I8DE74_9BACL|nr:DUF441 domain-containing protein [Effusibacillus dendaii]BCJ86820.1 UPF0756 membrane protein [Effusibacillus dendaii]